MNESVAKGMAKGLRQALLVVGEQRFGRPNKATANALTRISDPDQLELLNRHVLEVESWDELLATAPAMRQTNGRKRRKPE